MCRNLVTAFFFVLLFFLNTIKMRTHFGYNAIKTFCEQSSFTREAQIKMFGNNKTYLII